MAMLASLLDRTVDPELYFSRKDLQDQLTLGMLAHDARWLVTLLNVLTPLGTAPHIDHVEVGYAELLGLGLIEPRENELWQPSDDLVRLASIWKNPLPAMAHEVIMAQGDGEELVYRITIRGDGPLWVADYSGLGGDNPRIALRSVDGPTYALELMALLIPPNRWEQPATADRPTAICLSCRVPLAPGTKFCKQCGAPASRSAPSAAEQRARAGVPLTAGTTVSTPPAATRSSTATTTYRRCPNPQCGQEIAERKKFCTACGAPIHDQRSSEDDA